MDRMDGPRQEPRPAAPEALAARSWCDLWRLKTALGQGSFVFSDLHTRALAWQLKQVPCDTRDDDFRLNLQGLIDKALAALPERDPPWVMQWFLSDESDFSLSGGDFCQIPPETLCASAGGNCSTVTCSAVVAAPSPTAPRAARGACGDAPCACFCIRPRRPPN